MQIIEFYIESLEKAKQQEEVNNLQKYVEQLKGNNNILKEIISEKDDEINMLKEKLEKWTKNNEKLKKLEMESTNAFNTQSEQKVMFYN